MVASLKAADDTLAKSKAAADAAQKTQANAKAKHDELAKAAQAANAKQDELASAAKTAADAAARAEADLAAFNQTAVALRRKLKRWLRPTRKQSKN